MAMDKLFKGILQYSAEQFKSVTKEAGYIYLVRTDTTKTDGDAEIWFGKRRYGNVEATRLAEIESSIESLGGRVDAIEAALGKWVILGENLETVAKVVANHHERLNGYDIAIKTANENASEAVETAQQAVVDVTAQVNAANAAKDAAEAAQGKAVEAQGLAEGHASTASTKAGEASASAEAAATSEANAKTSETNAGLAKDAAVEAQGIAEGHASTASTKAGEASASATTAGEKASAADKSAKDAAGSASAAEAAKKDAEDLLAEVSAANTSASAIATEAKNAATSAVTTANEAKTIVDGLTVVKTTSSDTTIKEEYKLMSGEEQLGETIKIYKDSSIVSLELVDKDKDGNSGQFLKYTYLKADGSEDVVYVNVSDFLTQSEFGNGLTVSEAGVVSVLKDAASESYLTVSENGIKVSGIDAIKSTADTAVQAVSVAEGCEMLSTTKEGTTVTLALYYGGDDAVKYLLKVNILE